jgi:hypothetical protein
MTTGLSKEEVEEIVAASVLKTLENIGIDLTTADARQEFIKDQLYTRAWRKAVQSGVRVSAGTMLMVLVTGMLGVLWVGFQMLVGR